MKSVGGVIAALSLFANSSDTHDQFYFLSRDPPEVMLITILLLALPSLPDKGPAFESGETYWYKKKVFWVIQLGGQGAGGSTRASATSDG